MAVIAVYSMKGGVGKTTMAVDLAWRFAQRGGHQTLLFDLDPQGGAGFLLGHEERKVQRAISAFHHARAPRDLIEPTRFDGLSLIGADQSLRDLPVQLARIGTKKRLAVWVVRDPQQVPSIAKLGPDALAVTEPEFVEILGGTSARLKTSLVDQSLIAGIGNAYSDEILHVAKF